MTRPPTVGEVSKGQHRPPHSKPPTMYPPAPLPERTYRDSRRDWNVLQVVALILVIEALCFVALLWGQGWRP